MKLIIRWVGVWLIAGAVVALAVDGINSLANETMQFAPLGEVWFQVDPAGLNAAQAFIQRYTLPEVWDPLMISLLQLPIWAVVGPLGFFLVLLGRSRKRYDPLEDSQLT